MQIINQPSLSWSHSNKLLLTQWQFPNESINALYLNFIFSDVDIFCARSLNPRTTRLAGDFSSPPDHCKHTHTHTHTHTHAFPLSFSIIYIHTHTPRREIIPCPAALASRRMSITASEHPWKCSLTASLQHGHVQPHLKKISESPMLLSLSLI